MDRLYLGVILEIVSVPLLHVAYGPAVVFSLANLILLRHRICFEELALDEFRCVKISFN